VKRDSSLLKLVHRVEVKLLGSVGENGGKCTLHRRVRALNSERVLGHSSSNLREYSLRVMYDDPTQSPTRCKPSFRDRTDNEDWRIAADRGVRSENSCVELSFNSRSVGGGRSSSVRYIPGESSVDYGTKRDE